MGVPGPALGEMQSEAARRAGEAVNGVDKTYQCGGGMLYHLDDACWLWSDRRPAWVVGKLEPAGSELSVGGFVQR